MNLIPKHLESNNYFLEDSRGLNPFLYLIEQHELDVDNINITYDGIEKMHLRECDICNIIFDKKVILNGKISNREDALLKLDCFYWTKLLDDSKIRDLMPYTEYKSLVDSFKSQDKDRFIPFNKITVMSFIEKLSSDKSLLFANKVNSLFCDLDYSYKNNLGSMLPAMIVLKTQYSVFPSWENTQKVDDLRYSIRQIYGLDLNFDKTQNILSENAISEWISFDYDLIRIKRFKNANLHILLSDRVYNKLNEVISLVNKRILSQNNDKIRKNTYKYTGELND